MMRKFEEVFVQVEAMLDVMGVAHTGVEIKSFSKFQELIDYSYGFKQLGYCIENNTWRKSLGGWHIAKDEYIFMFKVMPTGILYVEVELMD